MKLLSTDEQKSHCFYCDNEHVRYIMKTNFGECTICKFCAKTFFNLRKEDIFYENKEHVS